MKYRKGIIALLVILTAGCSSARRAADDGAGESGMAGEVEPVTITGFKATGNEPFWAVEIEFENVLKFTSLTEKHPEHTFPVNAPERIDDLSVVKYSTRTYNAEAEVVLSREECRDTMKDTLFPYAVTVSIRPDHTSDYTVFRGCGRYFGPYRLNDIWVLEEIDGQPVDIPESRKKPTMEIDLSGRTIYGYGGCNRYHGRAELVNNNLVIGSLMSTKMACIDTQDIENKFLRSLSGKTMEFSIDQGVLTMTDGETELYFSRAE